MVRIVGLVFILVSLYVTREFILSAEKDAKGWVTPFERLAHPYSRRTKRLLLCFFIGMFFLFLPGLTLLVDGTWQ